MSKEQGSLSINSENIFPIIKKWLYSDHDIFYRELISNGCDAITKLKKLSIMGEFEEADDEKYQINVIVSPENKTIKIIDNGIGMTNDEVKQYINQIAFSGAEAFLAQYKDKTNEEQIIGHFGLGFYSAFMVADKVTIDTLSYKAGSTSVHWESEGGTEFEMAEGDKTTRGTEITLYLNEDSFEFSNEFRAKEVINKYCSFMPVEIYFTNADAPVEEKKEEEKKEDVIDADVDADGKAVDTEDGKDEEKAEDKGPKPLNNPTPLWTKHPNDCTEEEYKEFYRNVFHDFKEPLFWIHLNMDYPFNLKGILYFPKINTEYDSVEGTIKLYNNQVFIADNIKEVIPEFLMLLKGVIDCPDLPLNVSRSALQNDGFVKKISEYITKKVADKLSGMCKVEKESYEKYWDDISPFIKYGCLKDEKFREKMKDFIIFKNLEGKYITLPEYTEANKEKANDKIYYVTDLQQQSQYVNMFKEEGIDALVLTHNIDQPFISQLEQQDDKIHFQRIDADITDTFKENVAEGEEADQLKAETDALTELFRKVLNNDKLEVKVEKLKNENVSSMVTLSEENRRMQDMMKMYNMYGMDPSMFGTNVTLVLNANNKLVQYIFEHKEDDVTIFCEQLYDLALLSHKPLDPEAMTKFINRSNEIMLKMAK
ncbi:molecular chaperone HtpG [Anaerosporobacter faecicola]|uniref:molecular chaperone HtpG n=1 Tax=Anaerosporobacter faecicola TaxID=2718714 RepID=UPI00143B4AF5|nr:molecular chaperone HtpG [Anaerosporobacter faecicola]